MCSDRLLNSLRQSAPQVPPVSDLDCVRCRGPHPGSTQRIRRAQTRTRTRRLSTCTSATVRSWNPWARLLNVPHEGHSTSPPRVLARTSIRPSTSMTSSITSADNPENTTFTRSAASSTRNHGRPGQTRGTTGTAPEPKIGQTRCDVVERTSGRPLRASRACAREPPPGVGRVRLRLVGRRLAVTGGSPVGASVAAECSSGADAFLTGR